MLKVMIVDDDVTFQTNLRTMIDWNSNGFEICASAINGSTAIPLLSEKKPDIVITDMYMPVVDGVALTEYVKKNYSGTIVIALSSYDDYEYVRQSMKKGAMDYILKHRLDSHTLLGILNTARENYVIHHKRMDEVDDNIKKRLFAGKDTLAKNFMHQLLSGTVKEKSVIEENIRSLDLQLDMRELVVVAAEIDDYTFLKENHFLNKNHILIQSFIEITQEIVKSAGKAVVLHMEEGNFAIVFSFQNIRSNLFIYNELTSTIHRIKSSIKRYLNVTASFAVSSVCSSIEDLSEYYRQAENSLREKFFKGKDNILQAEKVKNGINGFPGLEIRDERDIEIALKNRDRVKVDEHIHRVFEKIVCSKMNSDAARMVCAELINIVGKVAKETGISTEDIYSNNELPYSRLQKYETINDIRCWIIDIYGRLISLMEASISNENYHENTRKAIGYIHRNYSKNISLNDAAEFIGCNSSYLSRVFKQDCGENFIEYLNKVRVDKAKLLMDGDYKKLKDIACKVGFNHYPYFSKVFKEITGKTPEEHEGRYR